MRRRRVPVPVSAAAHNRVLKLAAHRADRLESRLADAIEPILRRAGEEAARAFRARVTDHLTAAGDGVTSSSTMVAVAPRADERERIAADGGLDAETLHVTLAYLGELDGDLTDVVDALKPVAATHAPLVGEVAGAGFFGDPADEGPTVLLPDVPGLAELRVDAAEALARAGIDYSRDHGFLAHVTIDYRDGEPRPPIEYEPWGEPLHFDSLLVVRGDVVVAELPLVGVPPLTAAGEPPGWSAPAPDELLDLDALVAAIRAKTDPVREALLRETMTPALEQAGLAFDVTNPYVGNALAKSGAKVTNIAETTQANVMRTVRAAHDNGLSIPQTADVIRAGMASASGARATMIARTELAQVVNGGSLAATMIVASATGASYTKKWLTAPGAPSPRHELYEGLDGQEAGLEDYFDVGGSQLQYPGDADGDPGETINCRCTMSYDTPGGGMMEADADSPPDLEDASDGEFTDDSGGPPPGDTVSVPTGPFVEPQFVAKIDQFGLDRPLQDLAPTTDVGRDVYSAGRSTEDLYREGDGWARDRAELHEQIVSAHFEGKVAAEGKPTAYFTAGGGASGKSHAVFDAAGRELSRDELATRADTVLIDPDRIKEMLPEYAKLRDAGDLYAASGVHEESSALAAGITEEARARGLNVVLDSTGSSSGFVQKIADAEAAGYEVKVTMFSIPTNEAITRSMVRGAKRGRYVGIQALKSAHRGASQQLAIWKDSPNVSEWRVYDNTERPARLIAEGSNGRTTVYDQQAFASILAKANE